ncbi:hypothetical protein KA005_28680 [bacterium]|nr:hypothetical protein [bacterium]
MREIKFRAWDKKNKRMFTGDELNAIYYTGIIVIVADNNDWMIGKEDYVLMQYTGLTDANGKDVYEGDIVTDIEFTGEVLFHDRWYEVGMHAGLLAWCIFDKKSGKYIRLGGRSGGDCVNEYTWEIKGNIHENPELLEEKNERPKSDPQKD